MEDALRTTKTVYPISQFLDWQRQGTLDLSPVFQRRPVWKRPAKSLLIDSVLRGYPMPIIMLRQLQDLKRLTMRMEVVDGQQRIRTLLAFIDPDCLPDFDPEKDYVSILKAHNDEHGGRTFDQLPDDTKTQLFDYQLSTHVFPLTVSDTLIFRVFARLNSTGLSLNGQEVRNAEFHGAFKSFVYDVSFENLDRWRQWRIFSDGNISRMAEAEAVSEYIIAMMDGIVAKDQRSITKYYREHEGDFAESDVIRARLRRTLDAIDKCFGDLLPKTAFRRAALFYSLFSAVYDHMYGLESSLLDAKRLPKRLPQSLRDDVAAASKRIATKGLSEEVQDAMDRATSDRRRREIRHDFIMRALKLESRK